MTRWLAVVAALALAAPAAAAPKGATAKASFDRGVAAYQKGDFAAAAEALGASYKAEPDVETLFAWAQSERQLEHCDKAIELFTKLLGHDMPAENKKVVQSKIDECKEIVAAKQPVKPPPKEPDPAEKPAKPDQPEAIAKPPPVEKPRQESGGSPWWKDPIGDGLTGLGLVGLGVGGYYLVSARKAEQDSHENIVTFPERNKLAETNSKRGVIAAAAGGALLVGGIIRYATRGGDGGGSKEQRTVTGWLTPDGGGIAAFGRF